LVTVQRQMGHHHISRSLNPLLIFYCWIISFLQIDIMSKFFKLMVVVFKMPLSLVLRLVNSIFDIVCGLPVRFFPSISCDLSVTRLIVCLSSCWALMLPVDIDLFLFYDWELCRISFIGYSLPLVKYDNDEGISKPSICHMFNYSSHVTFQEMGAVLGTWFVIYFMAIQTCFFDNFELKVYIIVYSRIILVILFPDSGQKSEPLRFWFILPMNTNKPLFVPFVNEIFESTKGTYGAATKYLLRGQRICCFEAHMKLGSSPCYISGNGTQMKFSPFEGFAPHPIELGTDGHNPEEIKNVLGWMEQALIIQDCDYVSLQKQNLKITGVSLGSMQITFELAAMYPNLKLWTTMVRVDLQGFGPSFLNMFSDIKLGLTRRYDGHRLMLPFSSKDKMYTTTNWMRDKKLAYQIFTIYRKDVYSMLILQILPQWMIQSKEKFNLYQNLIAHFLSGNFLKSKKEIKIRLIGGYLLKVIIADRMADSGTFAKPVHQMHHKSFFINLRWQLAKVEKYNGYLLLTGYSDDQAKGDHLVQGFHHLLQQKF
ncbi:hypothetical protein ACJX0J_025266, partial [Zea mays]